MKNVWTAVEWEKKSEQKNVNKNIWAISNVENGFRCCYQQKEQKKTRYTHTYKKSMFRFFSPQSMLCVCLFIVPFVVSFSSYSRNIVIFVSDDVWTTQRQWWWCCSCCYYSGAADHHVYTLCVIKFVDCVPTWIQIIHANNGDVHRNGITTFFPVHTYISSLSIFITIYVLFYITSLSLSLSFSLSCDHSLFYLFFVYSLLAALNLFGFHSLTVNKESVCVMCVYILMFYYCFSSNQTYIYTQRSNSIQRAYFSTLKHESSQFRFGLCVDIIVAG